MFQIGGIEVDRLMDKVGSPLYVYDEQQIINQMLSYRDNFKSDMFKCDVIYASKAFSCTYMLKLVSHYGLCLDVVSGGELYVAEKAGFKGSYIYFHGNNKIHSEIEQALKYGVGTIIIDNMFEVDLIAQIAEELQRSIQVLIRINPRVEAHTHEFIKTASVDSKFGISMDEKDQIKAMIEKINTSKWLSFDGYHAHIGSQILAKDGFVAEIDTLVKFSRDMGYAIKVLNFGGGFGVRYTLQDEVIPTSQMCKTLIKTIEKALEKYHVSIEKACIEPGRSIVAEAGYTLYRVGFIKKTPNKQFAFVDGGMADNIRPALYGAQYRCDVANRLGEVKDEIYDIAGKCCESGDILIKGVKLPHLCSNDILVVYSTGAYGYTMASNYNRLNRLGVVFVKDAKAKIVIRPETYEDQLRCDCEKEVDL